MERSTCGDSDAEEDGGRRVNSRSTNRFLRFRKPFIRKTGFRPVRQKRTLVLLTLKYELTTQGKLLRYKRHFDTKLGQVCL